VGAPKTGFAQTALPRCSAMKSSVACQSFANGRLLDLGSELVEGCVRVVFVPKTEQSAQFICQLEGVLRVAVFVPDIHKSIGDGVYVLRNDRLGERAAGRGKGRDANANDANANADEAGMFSRRTSGDRSGKRTLSLEVASCSGSSETERSVFRWRPRCSVAGRSAIEARYSETSW